MRHALFLTIFSLLCLSSYAQESNLKQFGIETKKNEAPQGLSVGSQAPDFIAANQNGKSVKLYEITADKLVVLIFYRGFWCPYCNRYLQRYADSLEMITKRGSEVIAVTPERMENIQKTIEKTEFQASILIDADGKIMDKYQVSFDVSNSYQHKIKEGFSVDIARSNEQSDARLPVPATYIIDTNNQIVARQFDVDYSNRASVKWILKNLP
jgi:peroxiredoxin